MSGYIAHLLSSGSGMTPTLLPNSSHLGPRRENQKQSGQPMLANSSKSLQQFIVHQEAEGRTLEGKYSFTYISDDDYAEYPSAIKYVIPLVPGAKYCILHIEQE